MEATRPAAPTTEEELRAQLYRLAAGHNERQDKDAPRNETYWKRITSKTRESFERRGHDVSALNFDKNLSKVVNGIKTKYEKDHH
jgi:hypothetical protein